MTENPLYKKEDLTPCFLLNKQQAAKALAVSTRVLEALEQRGDIQSVSIPSCFPKSNPNAKCRRGPQPMKRYPVDALRDYVARLMEAKEEPTSEQNLPAASSGSGDGSGRREHGKSGGRDLTERKCVQEPRSAD